MVNKQKFEIQLSGLRNITDQGESACVWMVLILILYFYGDPDLHDALIKFLNK